MIDARGFDARYYRAADFDRTLFFFTEVLGLTVTCQGEDYAEFDVEGSIASSK